MFSDRFPAALWVKRSSLRFPSFFIIGAMKAGTTSLHAYLRRHPQVFMPQQPKEPQFFSRDHMFRRGFDWYKDLFSDATDDQICGEASTCYSRWPTYPRAAERLAAKIPDARLVYLLRHPVDRLYSHYVHEVRDRFVKSRGPIPSFEVFVEKNEEARCASQYSTQLRHLTKYFEESQVCIVLFEDLIDEPQAVLEDVQSFIGVECRDLVGKEAIHENSATAAVEVQIPSKISRRWVGRIRHIPGIRTIIDTLPVAWRRRTRRMIADAIAESSLGRRKARKFREQLSPMSSIARQRLCDVYAGEVRAIETLLRRDLSGWTR